MSRLSADAEVTPPTPIAARLTAHALGALIRPGLSWRSHGRLTVLIFHRVHASAPKLRMGDPDREAFRWRMALVKRYFHCLDLPTALQRLQAGALPPRALCVTFDDGYKDNVTEALPILQSLGLTASFFVASGYLDGGIMWNDRVIEAVARTERTRLDLSALGLGEQSLGEPAERQRLVTAILRAIKHEAPAKRQALADAVAAAAEVTPPDDLMMSADDVRRLHEAGMTIGGHTRTHPVLASIDDAQAWHEIAGNKADLEAITGEPLSVFAYPNGSPGSDYGRRHVRMAQRAGFKGALSHAWGVAGTGTDPYQVPRFTPWDKTPLRFLLRLFWNYGNTDFAVAQE